VWVQEGWKSLREEAVACLSATPAPQNESTPLHLAVERGYEEVAEKLLAAGAIPEVEDKVKGGCGDGS
jgi:hypothetical protein